MNYFIGEDKFRVFLPDLHIIEKSSDDYNSRQILGIMSSQRRDRQGEDVIAKGLDFSEFMQNGHFNDNHSQATSAIVGYPERVSYHKDLGALDKNLKNIEGWSCGGYVLKGTKRADEIWELAKALSPIPGKKLGFSIEGKVFRRENKTIKSAKIRNLAITSCPVNTDCSWNILEKSFYNEDIAMKALTAGAGTSPATQSGGSALRVESLDSDEKEMIKKRRTKALKKSMDFDGLLKSMEYVLERRPDFEEDAAAFLVIHLLKNGGYHG